MRSSRTPAGSSLGSCGTSPPRKALASSSWRQALSLGAGSVITGFDTVSKLELGFDAADDFPLIIQDWKWKSNAFKIWR